MTINIKTTNFMGQYAVVPPSINIDYMTLDVVDSFTYLGSTIYSNLSLDAEVIVRIAKAATFVAKLGDHIVRNI